MSRKFYSGFSFITLLLCFNFLSAQEFTVFGHVTTPLNGAMQPVEGAYVGHPYMNAAAITDENGYYEWVYSFPANSLTWILYCNAEGYTDETVTFALDPSQSEYEINFSIYPLPDPVETILHGQVIMGNGCLGGPLGCPIPGAMIEAVPLNSQTEMVFSGVAGEMGFYEIVLPTGNYHVICSAEGWVTQSQNIEIGPYGMNLDFALPEANQEIYLEGHIVTTNTAAGQNSPIGGAVIHLYNNNGAAIAETHSQDDGYYSFGEVAFDANRITVQADGYEEIDQEFSLDECNSFDCYPQALDFVLNPLDDFMLNGILFGNVNAQLSPMGPVFPLAGATIIASQSLAVDNVEYETQTGEDGNYLLELPGSEIPYVVTCWPTTNIGIYLVPITAEVIISEGHEVQLDFNFYGWDVEIPAPYNLIVDWELTPYGESVSFHWSYDLVTPNNQVVFQIYHSTNNDPNTAWTVIAETTETSFNYSVGGPMSAAGCYYVTAVGEDGIESDNSNIACTNDEPLENGVIYGMVFQEWGDAIAAVPGVPIIAVGLNTGTVTDSLIYETYTNEYGSYELLVNGGGYSVTAALEDGQTISLDVIVQIGQEVQLDFTFESGIEPEHLLIGEVICTDPNCIVESGIVHAANLYNEAYYEALIEYGFFILAVEHAGEYALTLEADGFHTVEMVVGIEGATDITIEMTPLGGGEDPLAWLISGNGSGIPGDTVIVPLYLQTTTTFAGLQFMATAYGLNAIGFESEIECFSAEYNEIYGQLFGLMFSLEGCYLDPGDHHLANMAFHIYDFWDQEYNETVIDLHEIIVSDAIGQNVLTEGVDGVVTMGMKGDVNGDGELNVLDIVIVVNFIMLDEPDAYEAWAADMNDDGYINVLDIVNMINLILG